QDRLLPRALFGQPRRGNVGEGNGPTARRCRMSEEEFDIREFEITPEQIREVHRLKNAERAKARIARLWLRIVGPFAAARQRWLQDRRWDKLFTPRGRLFLYLQIKSKEGARPVQLSADELSSLGIPRSNKLRELRELERIGLISVSLNGKRSVEVLVNRWP